MKSLPIGFLCLVCVLAFSVGGAANWALYANLHSIVIVIGGSASILFFATPLDILKNVGSDIAGLAKSKLAPSILSAELKSLSETKTLDHKSQDPLINRAVELWEKGLSADLFLILLNQTKIDIDQKSADSIQALRNLSKYPPALGMAGTVMGLVSLFSNLNQADKTSLGPSLALAMTATFFGLIVTNMLITPLADRLQVKHINQRRHLTNVYQILCLIHRDEALTVVEDEIIGRSLGGEHAAA